MEYHDALVETNALLAKTPGADPGADVAPALAVLEAASGPIPAGVKFLDLGCGVGAGVAALVAAGYDAQGVDIMEYWGKDEDLFWLEARPPIDIRDRLRVAPLVPYRLPFESGTFDYLISMQVLEHVDDRHAVFAEIARVLKPGAISVHFYPDPWWPVMEGHINVPFSPLCKLDWYLKLAALAGFRSARQGGLSWREVYRANAAQMEMTHYAPRHRILRDASRAGLSGRFAEYDYVARSGTGWTRLHRRLSRARLGWTLRIAARLILQPMLVLVRPAAG
jgi:SAM-dependent methyltransferase